MIQCIIFDCDGTLVDSEYLCNLGLEIKLKEYDISVKAEEIMHEFRGQKLANILSKLQEKHNVRLSEGFEQSYRSIVDELFEESLKPCQGVKEFLATTDMPVCVASSGPKSKIMKALSLTGLFDRFEGRIFSSYDIGSWKPEPGIFIHAAHAMGFKNSQCLVVEDSLVGIEAASRAKMAAVLYDPVETHSGISGTKRIKHMSELSGCFT